MPVPNEDQVTYLDQSELDTGDFTIWENVHQGYSVLSGGVTTAQGTPDGTVAVASGVARVGGATVTISAGNVSVISGSANADSTTALAADGSGARFSLITVNSSGQTGVRHGATAALSSNNDGSYLAEFPTFSGLTVLASVFIPPTFTTVATSMLSDKRIVRTDGDFAARIISPTAISATTNNYSPTGLATANTVRQATNNTTQRNVTGLVPTAFADGKLLAFHNIGPGPIGLVDESASSTAANRFSLDGDIVLPVDRGIVLQYDTTSSRWRVFGGQSVATTNSLVIGTAAAAGTSPYFVRSDDTIAHEAAHVAHDTIWAAKGDLVVASANDSAAVLTAPTTWGKVLGADDLGNVSWVPTQPGPSGLRLADEFFYNANVTASGALGQLALTVSGTAAQYSPAVIASTASHPGVGALDTGTGTTGRTTLSTPITGICLGGGRARFDVWVRIPTVSDGTDTYSAFAGFSDSVTDAPVDAAYLHYSHGVNSGKWEAKTSSNSVATVADTTITVATGTWYRLSGEVNAAGTSSTFWVDGANATTITTNIPTGAGRELGFMIGIIKSAGTTNRQVYVDAYRLELDFTTAR